MPKTDETNLVCQNRQKPSSLATRFGISTVCIIQRRAMRKLHQGHLVLASHAGVSKGARFSSPKNACLGG